LETLQVKRERSKKNPPKPEAVVAPVSTVSEEAPSNGISLRTERVVLGLILLVGFILRAWYLAEIVHAPDFTALQQDPAVQDYHARGIAFGDWSLPQGAEADPEIRTTPYFRPPGHAYFLSAIYFLTGGSYLAVRLVNMALGLGSILLMFKLGKRMFGSGAGLIAAAFMSTYWGFVFWEGEVNDPCLFVFLGTLLMLTACRWAEKASPWLAAAAGLICGGYALMRPNILLFGPFLALWMLWIAWRKNQLKRLAWSWVWLAGCTFMIITPVTIRNYVAAGEFVPISTYFGENFLIGNGPEADGVTPWTPYLQTLEGTGNWSVWVYINVVRGAGRELGVPNIKHSEASKYFYKQTLDYIKTHKLRTLGLMFKKAVLFWSPIEITCNKVVQFEKEYYPPLKYLPGFPMAFATLVVGVAAFLSDLRSKRVMTGSARWINPAAMALLAFAFVAVYYISFLPFFVNGRARVPVIPFCFLFGAYGIYRIFEHVRSRRYKIAGAWAVAFVALYVLVSIQYIKFEPDRSRWFYQRADSCLRTGHLDKAIEEARNLLPLPDTAAYMNMRLARAFAEQGHKDEAFEHFMAALKDHPDDPDVQFNGAGELIKIGRVAEGVAHYNEALRLKPNDARIRNNLGLLLEDQGKMQDALAQLREAVRIDPKYALARNNLGNALRYVGSPEALEEAVACFKQGIETSPKEKDFHYNLASLLAETDRKDEAINEYEKTLELDSKDVRAHNNLGLLLAENGRRDEAMKHYEDALRIDPKFVLVYANIGNLLDGEGKTVEGISEYNKGLGVNPDDSGLHNGIGYLYAKSGDAASARKHYEEALRIAPNFPLALNNYGNLLASNGDVEGAISRYRHALEIDPHDKHAYFNMAEARMNSGEYQEAVNLYQQAVKNDPKNPNVLNALANALVRNVRFSEAIEYYDAALRLDPKHMGALCNLGSVLNALGRTQEAAGYFRKALAIDPNNNVAKDGLNKIEGISK
jgi:tetratricopeptide (TPR) repeat protein